MKILSSIALLALIVPSLASASYVADPAELKQYLCGAAEAHEGVDLDACEIARSPVQAPTEGQVNFAVVAESGQTEYVALDCANAAASAAARKGPGPFGWLKRLFSRNDGFRENTDRKTRKFMRGQRPVNFRVGCNVGKN